MKKLLLTTVCVMTLPPAHADFMMRGVMQGLMTNGQVTCSQYTKWVKTHPGEREVMNQWILGFYSGVESQLTNEPRNSEATGSEQSTDGILNMVKSFCNEQPKQMILAIVAAGADYGLELSIKNHDTRYQHGFNVHGVLATSTCQNLIMETEGEASSNGMMMKVPTSSDRKFLLEEWILGAASGIESQVLYGKSQRTEKVSNEDFLDSIYSTCRAHPTSYVFRVVLDQELANIEAIGADADGTGKYWGDGTTDTGKSVGGG